LLVGNLSPASAQTTREIARGNCKSCAASCQKTMDWCTTKAGKYAEAGVTNSLKDCVTACKMTEDFPQSRFRFGE